MVLKNTVPIVFNGGSYGTYLEWALTALTTKDKIVLPFLENGSSHKFIGHHLKNMEGWQQYLDSESEFKFVRFHPKVNQQESLTGNLETILNHVGKVIHLYPDKKTTLLAINNYYFKIWNNWWEHQFMTYEDFQKIYKNWPVNPSTPVNQIPTWIKREFLSLYLIKAWQDQVEWFHPDRWQHPRCMVINVCDLLYDFESSLFKLQKFCNLDYVRDPSEIKSIHDQMLSLQQYLDQDLLCNQIVDAVINCRSFEWNTLPLISESWIQWQLRNLGFEIQCHGLDVFPTNSIQLKKLTFPI